MDEDLEDLKKSIQEDTDISKGIIELFKDMSKDEKNYDLEHHPVDIRTRLNHYEVRGMSIINYLTSIKMKGLVSRQNLNNNKKTKDTVELSKGLNILTHHVKRHKYSFDGKSRQEIIELMKSKVESLTQNTGFRSIFGGGK